MKEIFRRSKGKRLYSTAYCIFLVILGLVQAAYTQNQTTQPPTDPSEASALNTIFEKWGVGAWIKNSSNICTVNSTVDDPLIECDCSFNNDSICHITKLQVYTINGTGTTIPDELWTLTYLTTLTLLRTVLTGPLSPSIGNLTRLQYLDLGINALSGELPKELGMLSNLFSVNLGTNNFSGSLPSELGNLTKLEQLYFDSAGVSGPLPSTFANLRNLEAVRASDNELTGPIPDFIGNWSKLTRLILHGTSFDGPIPSSLSTLTSLTDLRISEISSGSSSLAFIKDMKNLTILILRKNNISDSIPSTIGEYSSLAQLFLGNNSLNGSLPAQKSSSLVNMDLSYNFLAGSFPSWVNSESNLTVNLVGNNFTITNANSSRLASGLNCLQRNFPCNRGSPIYSSFAIKCGGPWIQSSSGILYERDDSPLGPATFYVTDTQRWAVSNGGYFNDIYNPSYIYTSQSQFTNTLDPELYRTARISASSLRYYGLGLKNGNYTVRLQFAESAITNTNWKSLGRRIFDIYIQGSMVAKDFDIRKEAGGLSFAAVEKNFSITVTENYLEIHLFWAGKGTCCLFSTPTYGPMISAISTTPNLVPAVSDNPPTSKKNQMGMLVGVAAGVAVVGFLAVFLVLCLVRRRKLRRAYEDQELLGIHTRPYTFSYAELKAATDDFNPINKLGEGGFGSVFKGELHDGRVIAVKLLSVTSKHGRSQFVAEIATISAVQQRNLVKLYGCCIEGEKRLIVYEYLENKSLDQALFGERSLNLNWSTRYEICLGVARGLAYLHEESRLRIIHRDVKTSNILLDSNLIPKISDFGLAKLYDDEKSHISTRVAGTLGYLAPEYAMRGHLTEKTDVFAFGVVALELVSGRHNFDESLGEEKAYLLEWAWKLHEAKQEIQLIDPLLLEFDEEEVKRVVTLGLLCTQTSPVLRPTMSRVVTMLMGDAEVSPVTTKPGYLTNWRYNDNGEEAPILGNTGSSSKSEYTTSSGTAGISVSFTSEGR